MSHTGRYESPSIPEQLDLQSPAQLRTAPDERTNNKRPRVVSSPASQPRPSISRNQPITGYEMTHPAPYSKTTFPPFILKFEESQQSSIKEITDELVTEWKKQHGIDLMLTARFGHLHSLLIFADDSSTFESLLDPIRWPKRLKNIQFTLKTPRQLPPNYSLVIQQFHRNWNEDEWLEELQQRYVSLFKITRMRVKDGAPLNSVRADFRSIDEVKTLIRSGKINIGSMIHPIKPYHPPIRINKCQKCLRHDHTTSSCSHPRICPRCAEVHSLEQPCQNKVKCVNCGGEHISGHSACPIVQEKRQALVEQAKKHRAEMLVNSERHQNRYGTCDYDSRTAPMVNSGSIHHRTTQQPNELPQKSYAQAVNQRSSLDYQQNIDYTLSSFFNRFERRLDEISFRLSSQLSEIEMKLNSFSDRQDKLERVINEIILPSIQVLGQASMQNPSKTSKQIDFKKIVTEISVILKKLNQYPDIPSQQTLPEHAVSLSINAPKQ